MHSEANFSPKSSNTSNSWKNGLYQNGTTSSPELNIKELILKEIENHPEEFLRSWNYKSEVSVLEKSGNVTNDNIPSCDNEYVWSADYYKIAKNSPSGSNIGSLTNDCTCHTDSFCTPTSALPGPSQPRVSYRKPISPRFRPQIPDIRWDYPEIPEESFDPIDEWKYGRKNSDYRSETIRTSYPSINSFSALTMNNIDFYTSQNRQDSVYLNSDRRSRSDGQQKKVNNKAALRNVCNCESCSSNVDNVYDEDISWMSKLQITETNSTNMANMHDPHTNKNNCCSFCYGLARKMCIENGLPIPRKDDYGKWSTHSCARNKKVVCPVLFNVVCKECGATGENAHTTKNCWKYTHGMRRNTFSHSQSFESYFPTYCNNGNNQEFTNSDYQNIY